MDLALAHLAESKLGAAGTAASPRLSAGSGRSWSNAAGRQGTAARRGCAGQRVALTLLGSGSRLVGGAALGRAGPRRGRAHRRRRLLSARSRRRAAQARTRQRAGRVRPAVRSDAAVTRHLAAFLRGTPAPAGPTRCCSTAACSAPPRSRTRLHATLAGWRGAPLQALHNADPDIAVARGAVAYALARRGLAPRIGGGSPRSHFLLLDGAERVAARRAARRLPAAARQRGRPRGRPRRPQLRAARSASRCASTWPRRPAAAPRAHCRPASWSIWPQSDARAAAADRDADRARQHGGAAAPAAPGRKIRRTGGAADRGRHAGSALHRADDAAQRWKLEFQLRGDADAAGRAERAAGRISSRRSKPSTASSARATAAAGPRPVKQLRDRLETLLGSRDRWPTALLRPLFDALMAARARPPPFGRPRAAVAEPGRLVPAPGLSARRSTAGASSSCGRCSKQGVQHGHDAQVNAEWWTLWRRVAGGLDAAAQQRLLDDFAVNLRGDEAGLASGRRGSSTGAGTTCSGSARRWNGFRPRTRSRSATGW